MNALLLMRIPNEVAIHLLTLDFASMSPLKPKAHKQGCPPEYVQQEGYNWFVQAIITG